MPVGRARALVGVGDSPVNGDRDGLSPEPDI